MRENPWPNKDINFDKIFPKDEDEKENHKKEYL